MTPEQFKSRLIALGWSQAEFSRKTGVTTMTISRWMTGGITKIPSWVDGYLQLAEGIKGTSKLIDT